ncbi:hypothetical protein D6C95_10331 [Aureobasidium pullulans]|nr:hypothetical protein D6C95_10331 [Aureobasidium pullulans]
MATIHIDLYALPPGWSDGTVYTWPLFHPTIIYTMDPSPLALLSAEFNRVPGYVHDLGGPVMFWDLPYDYCQFSHPRSDGRPIREIFGHSSGGHYSSVRTFLVHVVHIMRLNGRTLAQCPCVLCRPPVRKPVKKTAGPASGNKGGPAGRKGIAKKTAGAPAPAATKRALRATAPRAAKA